MEPGLLPIAIQYLESGFSIIPIGRGKKAAQTWKEFQTRKPTRDEVEHWFSKESTTGIGIVTGEISGIAVLDIDPGADVAELNIPETLTAITGRGGRHFYFRYHDGAQLKNVVGLRHKVDFRTDGGYVVAPPSLHPSGNRYQWVDGFNMNRIAPMPEWLIDELREKTIPRAEKKLWQAGLGGVSEGQRNNTAASLCGYLLRQVSPNKAWSMLLAWNGANTPPLDVVELKVTFDSIAQSVRPGEKFQPKMEPEAKVIFLKELMSRTYPAQKFIVDKLIPVGGMTIISGEAATFKTKLALHVAVQAAKGERVFGEFATEKTRTLVIDEDNGDTNLYGVFKELTDDFDLPVAFMIYPGATVTEGWANKIVDLAKGLGIGLVILDSLFRFGIADENKANEVSRFMNILKIFKMNGIAVLAIHHNRKSGVFRNESQEIRGSSAFRDSVDCHLSVRRTTQQNQAVELQEGDAYDEVIINQTKIKNSREVPEFRVGVIHRKVDGKIAWQYGVPDKLNVRKEEVMTCILAFLRQKGVRCTRQEIIEACRSKRLGESLVNKVLVEMRDAKLLNFEKGYRNKHFYWLV